MAHSVRVNGTWRNTVIPYTKVAGVWKPAKAVYNKVNGSWKSSFLQGGVNDFGFFPEDTNPGVTGLNNFAKGILYQSDGKIILFGSSPITSWNGTPIRTFVRLNQNMTIDSSFMNNVGTGSGESNVFAVAIQPDGKILVGGSFQTWNGATAMQIVRLNQDGTRDTAFSNNIGTGAGTFENGIYSGTGNRPLVSSISVRSDGKILVGGQFRVWNEDFSTRFILCLNSNGTKDTAFHQNMKYPWFTLSNAPAEIADIKFMPDNSVIFAGNIAMIFPNPDGSGLGYEVGNVFKVFSNGSVDTSFSNNSKLSSRSSRLANKIAIDKTDNSVIVVGNSIMIKFLSSGQADSSFMANVGTGAGANLTDVIIQEDRKVIVCGTVSIWNGASVKQMVRLNSSGTRDTAFSQNILNSNNNLTPPRIESLSAIKNDTMLITGDFKQYAGMPRSYLARIGTSISV
jgi:uncharacterized delta-60 repeat protein